MNLVAAALFLAFSSGRWVVPLAAWLSPIFLLRFVRGGHALPRPAAAGAAIYLVGCLTWRGMVPVPAPGYFAIMLVIMLPTLLPYVAGRFVPRDDAGFGTTLVFPSAWVVTEYLISRTSPYGSWGLVAYTQVDHLPLIQSVAVTGLWGIGFLVAWTASVVNWVWERGFDWSRVRAGALIWGGTLSAVLLLGGARLVLAPPAPPTLRIASFTIPPPERLSPQGLITRGRSGAALDSLRADLHAHHDTLFAAVRREAGAGARLVAWVRGGGIRPQGRRGRIRACGGCRLAGR